MKKTRTAFAFILPILAALGLFAACVNDTQDTPAQKQSLADFGITAQVHNGERGLWMNSEKKGILWVPETEICWPTFQPPTGEFRYIQGPDDTSWRKVVGENYGDYGCTKTCRCSSGTSGCDKVTSPVCTCTTNGCATCNEGTG
jgi:hypothetical protein